MWRAVKVRALSRYRIEVEFEDGLQGVIDLSQDLRGPMFESVRDPAKFAEVGLDEYGVVCWPNGADLAPDALYDDIKALDSAAR